MKLLEGQLAYTISPGGSQSQQGKGQPPAPLPAVESGKLGGPEGLEGLEGMLSLPSPCNHA